MAIQELNQVEVNEVAGGLSLVIGGNPIINGVLDIAPAGIFTLLNGLLLASTTTTAVLTGIIDGVLATVTGLLGKLGVTL